MGQNVQDPNTPRSHFSCAVSTQALFRGAVETSVFGVASTASRPGGRAHVGLRYGRVLLYLEDRAALDSLAGAVRQALDMADGVFGPTPDAFTETEARARARFQRTGNVDVLR